MSGDAVCKDENGVRGVVGDELETARALFLSSHFVFGQKVFPGRRGRCLGERGGLSRMIDPGSFNVPDYVEGDDGYEDGNPDPECACVLPGV